MKLFAVLCLVVTVTVISTNAFQLPLGLFFGTEDSQGCSGSSDSCDSESKEHSNSESSDSSGSGSNESTPEEKCEEKPVFLKVMDVNRGIAHCGPENILNTCACELDELYWIPCLIEYLAKNVGVKDQFDCYTCVSLEKLDCYLRQFPTQCMPHCPNGYGCNSTCVP